MKWKRCIGLFYCKRYDYDSSLDLLRRVRRDDDGAKKAGLGMVL